MTRRKTNGIIYATGAIIFVILLGFIVFDNAKQPKQAVIKSTAKTVVSLPTQANGKLTPEQKAKVVAVITENTNHFKKLWQDGQTALGTTQYVDANAGLAAFINPNSAASKFSKYKQTENPVNDLTFNNALKKADTYYPSNVSDDNLNTWRMDMMQLTGDMGTWVTDATGWQIQTVTTVRLTSDANTVNQDFAIVQKDIEAIQ